MTGTALRDGSVARMRCTATILARQGSDPGLRAAAESLTRDAVPRSLAQALAEAFAAERVVIVREVHCTVSAAWPAGSALPEVLGRHLAREIARLVGAGTCEVMTFASTADYIAAYLGGLRTGSAGRWYFEPFRDYHGLPLPEVVASLHREMPELMPVVWRRLQTTGGLAELLGTVDDAVLDQAWRQSAPVRLDGWLAVARMALALTAALGWPVRADRHAASIAGELARTAAADLVWTDGRGMARAVLDAVTAALARPGPELPPVTPDALARWDWLDVETLAAGLRAVRAGGHAAGTTETEDQPRTGYAPAPGRPAGPSPRRTALIELARRLLHHPDIVVIPGRPAMLAAQLWSAAVRERPDLDGQTWARGVVRAVAEQVAARAPGPPEANPVVVAAGDFAGALLLLRSLDDLRVAPHCRRAGVDPATLLRDLLALWSGVPPDDRALLAAVREIAAEPVAEPVRDLPWLDRTGDPADPADRAALRGAPADVEELGARVLRHWTGWLRGFAGSSIPFVLGAFVRRPGTVSRSGADGLVVRLERRPHDVVLELSGYLDPISPAWPWGARRAVPVTFGWAQR